MADCVDEDNALVEELTAEEIAALKIQFDPENELLPANERAPNQTDKAPTGAYDRNHLLEHMKQEALNSEVGKDWVQFEKKKRGKVWKPKPKTEPDDQNILPNELTDVLENASESELMELAAVLGLHGMLNQNQSHEVDADKMWKSLKGSGLKKYKPGVVKSTKYKQYTDVNAVNELDIESAMKKLESEDVELEELNLNNHKDATLDVLSSIANKLHTNQTLKRLYIANCHVTDPIAKEFASALKVNKTLQAINMESNHLTQDGIMALLSMLETNTTLTELKLSNQAQASGHQLEMNIARTLDRNKTLLRFGFTFESRGPRHMANKHILRNNDAARKARVKQPEFDYHKVNGER
eukprot:gene19462-21385_t